MEEDFELFADNDTFTDSVSVVVPPLSASPELGNPDSMPHCGPSRMPERKKCRVRSRGRFRTAHNRQKKKHYSSRDIKKSNPNGNLYLSLERAGPGKMRIKLSGHQKKEQSGSSEVPEAPSPPHYQYRGNDQSIRMRLTKYPLVPQEPRVERISRGDEQVVLRFTANGIPSTIGTMIDHLRQSINAIDPSGTMASRVDLRDLAARPHSVPSLWTSLTDSLCLHC
jgi:hypothetical protein